MMKPKAKRPLCIAVLLALVMCATFAFASCQNTGEPNNTEYTITFVTDSATEIEPITVKHGEMAEKPENPRKDGHVFKGWYTDLNNTENAFIFDETPVTSNLTLYALWQIRQYTITYQDNNGNVLDGIGGTADWGTLLTKPDETAYAKDGYILKWYTTAGDIWDFETSKVVANTTLSYQYVTTKDTYNAADIAENFYPSYDRGDVSPEKNGEYYKEGDTGVYYTYGGTGLQEVILNVELSTLDYESVTAKIRSVGYSVNDETGEYTFDAANGDTFQRFRAYILTDVGGHLWFNDQGASGYNPMDYYIESIGHNKELWSQETKDGWTYVTFDLASLGFWRDGKTLYGFALGFVTGSKAVEIESIVFNKADKNAQYEVKFEDRMGNTLADTQTVGWNKSATKPAKLEDADGRVYTGEWLDSSGKVFDFAKGIRGNATFYPQYTVTDKYSWTGAEVGKDFFAVQNEDKTLPATEYANADGNTVFTYNNGKGDAIKLITSDCLDLPIGEYKYLTAKLRIVDYAAGAYVPTMTLGRVRMYLLTDVGGDAMDKDLVEGKENYYIDFSTPSTTEVTTPIDVSAKLEDGWYIVTIDMTAIPYYATGTTIKGFSIGMLAGAGNGFEVSEIYFSKELATSGTKTVTFVGKDGNAITGIPAQTVPYGKAATMPDVSLIPLDKGDTFAYWADENGKEFSFATAVVKDMTLKATFSSVWEGADYIFKGQDIVENFTATWERYGSVIINGDETLAAQNKCPLTLNAEGKAQFDFSVFNKPNMVLHMFDAGIRVHEGSKLVVTYKSNKYPDFDANRLNLCVAFRGQDYATQIKNFKPNPAHFEYKDIPYGTTTGTGGAASSTTFVIAADGTVTVTFDLYAMQQYCIEAGLSSETVDLNYIDGFAFMIVESTGASAETSNATITYESFEFVDVQLDKKPAYTLIGQSIVENFTSSYERYGNTTASGQKQMTLVDGNAVGDYTEPVKPNKALTTLDADIKVKEGSKLVITFQSSIFAEGYNVSDIKIGLAFRGEDYNKIINSNAAKEYNLTQHYYQLKHPTMVSYTVTEDGIVTATFDLYAMSQDSSTKVEEGVDVTYIDGFTFLYVEKKESNSVACKITYYSIVYQNVEIGTTVTEDNTTGTENA